MVFGYAVVEEEAEDDAELLAAGVLESQKTTNRLWRDLRYQLVKKLSKNVEEVTYLCDVNRRQDGSSTNTNTRNNTSSV